MIKPLGIFDDPLCYLGLSTCCLRISGLLWWHSDICWDLMIWGFLMFSSAGHSWQHHCTPFHYPSWYGPGAACLLWHKKKKTWKLCKRGKKGYLWNSFPTAARGADYYHFWAGSVLFKPSPNRSFNSDSRVFPPNRRKSKSRAAAPNRSSYPQLWTLELLLVHSPPDGVLLWTGGSLNPDLCRSGSQNLTRRAAESGGHLLSMRGITVQLFIRFFPSFLLKHKQLIHGVRGRGSWQLSSDPGH